MPLVIDASVMANWHFSDEREPKTLPILKKLEDDEETALVPEIWWFEVHHVLLRGERRGRTTQLLVEHFLAFLLKLPIAIAANPEAHDVLSLARRHRLTFYDAAYLELAQRENIALATLDQALARAAAVEGVPLIGA